MDYTESYLHYYAKKLLLNWLSNCEIKGEDYTKSSHFMWGVNYGIYGELPFFEKDDPYYFESSSFMNGAYINDRYYNKLDAHDYKIMKKVKKYEIAPTKYIIENSINRGKLLFIPDITIFHKGTAMILIEVVNTNYVNYEKISKILNFFDGDHLEIYEVDAYEILSKTEPTLDLNFNNIWNG